MTLARAKLLGVKIPRFVMKALYLVWQFVMPLKTMFDIGPSNISFRKVAKGDCMLFSQSFHVKNKCFNSTITLVIKESHH